jgi:hypothetical protein
MCKKVSLGKKPLSDPSGKIRGIAFQIGLKLQGFRFVFFGESSYLQAGVATVVSEANCMIRETTAGQREPCGSRW